MSEKTPEARTSYTYARREITGSFKSDFYKDAGLSRDAFEALRTGQRQAVSLAKEQPAERFLSNRLDLPEPHPAGLEPDRETFDRDWQEKVDGARTIGPLSKDEFLKSREVPSMNRAFKKAS